MRAWINAARPRTLPLAIAGVLLGAVPPGHSNFNGGLAFVMCLLTAGLLQILSNFANDWGDTQNGADANRKVGPTRAVQSGRISSAAMKSAITLTGILAFISGFFLLYYTLWWHGWKISFFSFLLIGLAGIAAAYFYTAGARPYGYQGLGDIAVFLFFGLVSVMGTHFLLYLHLDKSVVYLAVMQGLLSMMVLHLNNMRDFDDDAQSRKYTMAIKLGKKGSQWYYNIAIFLSQILLVLWLMDRNDAFSWLSVIPSLLLVPSLMKVNKDIVWLNLDNELKKVALASFFVSLLLFLGTI